MLQVRATPKLQSSEGGKAMSMEVASRPVPLPSTTRSASPSAGDLRRADHAAHHRLLSNLHRAPSYQLEAPGPRGGVSVGAERGCARQPAAADRTRYVVVSHPYDEKGEKDDRYEVLEVSTNGEVSRPGHTFEMGRAPYGEIEFTRDGRVGVVAQEDGTLGVFRLDENGKPTVVHEAFGGSFYASDIVMDPNGDRLFVLDRNWANNGGGIYLVTIGCDGTLTDRGRLAPAKAPAAVVFLGDRAVVAASELESDGTADNVHLVDWSETPEKITGTSAFGDETAIIGGTALTADGTAFLVGDVNGFSGIPNRVAAVEIRGDRLKPLGTMKIEDPEAIEASPFGNVAIVTSTFGDAIYVLTENPDSTWSLRGQVHYKDGKPQLPGDMTAIERGSLRGHVFVSEVSALRHLAFTEDGSVVDLGLIPTGRGYENINGAVGITP